MPVVCHSLNPCHVSLSKPRLQCLERKVLTVKRALKAALSRVILPTPVVCRFLNPAVF
jgi:hypothetical protein